MFPYLERMLTLFGETMTAPPNASEGIRTLTKPGLNRFPLPIGIREQNSGQGRTRTFGVSDVTDLQSAALAARHTCP